MGYYILRRILLFIPNLLLVSFLVFGLSALIPGSPVLTRMPQIREVENAGRMSAFQYEKQYTRQAKALGLDKPLFYLSVHSRALPDTLYRIFPETRRETMVELARATGSWQWTQDFHDRIRMALLDISDSISADTTGQMVDLDKELRFLLEENDPERIARRMEILKALSVEYTYRGSISEIENHWRQKESFQQTISWWLPEVDWNGSDNRYHVWLSGALKGRIGTSIKDGQPAMSPILKALRWTLLLNVSALIGVLILAIPMGIYAAWWKDSAFDRWSHRIVYLFYSVPGFWLASLSIVFLTSDTYGKFWHWFNSAGITNYRPDLPFTENLSNIWPELLLPVIILILPSLAFLFRQTRTAMLEEFGKSYVLTARARGLTGNELLWRTVFPNATFPILTMIGGAIPGLISGSLIMEVIFAIPGMGRLMYESMLSQDWNVLQGVIIIGTLLVMVSYLVTDLLYAWMDPKIRLR